MVLVVDVDRFKMINDSLDHRAGDTLLQQLGARLRHGVQDGDTVARLGGDQFLVLMRGSARRPRSRRSPRGSSTSCGARSTSRGGSCS